MPGSEIIYFVVHDITRKYFVFIPCEKPTWKQCNYSYVFLFIVTNL